MVAELPEHIRTELANELLSVLDTADIAYIREVKPAAGVTQRVKGYAVCRADGKELAILPSREAAIIAAKQLDLTPFSTN